jgi:hypothetical protein
VLLVGFPVRCMDEDLEEIFTLWQMYSALASKRSGCWVPMCRTLQVNYFRKSWGILSTCLVWWATLHTAPCSRLQGDEFYIGYASLTPLWCYYIGSNSLWLECFRITRFTCAWSRHMQLETLWDHVYLVNNHDLRCCLRICISYWCRFCGVVLCLLCMLGNMNKGIVSWVSDMRRWVQWDTYKQFSWKPRWRWRWTP